MIKPELNIDEIIAEYKQCHNLHTIAKKYKTSHIRLSKLLKENNFEILNVGKKTVFDEETILLMIDDYIVNKLTTEAISKKYKIQVKRLRAIFKQRNITISKWNGHTKKETTKKEKPVKIKKPTKKCPYCDWETVDVENKGKSYQNHIINKHKVSVDEHLEKYPDDMFYFKTYIKKKVTNKNKIQCQICGKFLCLIDDRHLLTHGITKQEYIEKYGLKLTSDDTKIKLQGCLGKMYDNPDWDRQTSKYEEMIKSLLTDNNIEYIQHDRQVLNGLELDFIVGEMAIEFHGNKYHTEFFGGKKHKYHLNKTEICNKKGYSLVQIFEDEYVNNKELVEKKVLHILGCQQNLPKIYGRKCVIKEIYKYEAEEFLNKYHIQGFANSTIYLGSYYNNELIAVMCFRQERKGGNEWELTRFASDYNYICSGVGGKMFSYFIKKYNPNNIKSFADRRWTIKSDNNLYTKLGFKLTGVLKPDYKYYNTSVDRYQRFHKFGFRKQILHKKYGFPLTMTEREMTKELGYDRIWDCGLFKYEWKKI
jgi:very-short-patch-repair endonuclease/predicted transcriptional regulator